MFLRDNFSPVDVFAACLQNYDVGKIIYEKGCVQAGEEWVERNLLTLACTAVTIAFVQVRNSCILVQQKYFCKGLLIYYMTR